MATKTIFTGDIDGKEREIETFATGSNSIFIEIEDDQRETKAIEIDLETAKDFIIELQCEVKKIERRLDDE